MLMTLLFDVSFKDWFVGVYMENMVPMLRDTLHRMLDPHYINPLLDRARENENGRTCDSGTPSSSRARWRRRSCDGRFRASARWRRDSGVARQERR